MGLLAWIGLDTETGATAQTAKPINNGVAVMATEQPTESTGFFGWLDDIGTTIGTTAGRAVDAVADNWIEDLNAKNDAVVKTTDQTTVGSDAQLPLNQSFFEANKTAIMYGGIGLLAVGALVMTLKK